MAVWPWLMGAGLAKSMLIDKPKEEHQRQVEATKALYSPWTGITPGQVKEADPFGSGMQGAMMGLALDQNAARTKSGEKLMKAQQAQMKAQTDMLKAQTEMMGGMQGPAAGMAPVPSATAPGSGMFRPGDPAASMSQSYGQHVTDPLAEMAGVQSPYAQMGAQQAPIQGGFRSPSFVPAEQPSQGSYVLDPRYRKPWGY